MLETEARLPSIRRRLVIILVPSLLLLVGFATLLSYWLATRAAASAYDRALVDPVLDLAENVRQGANGPQLDMIPSVQDALLFDRDDTAVFQIRGPDGEIIAGVPDLPPRPQLAVADPTYYDGDRNGQPVRIAAVRTDSGFTVQVAETLNRRHQLVEEILAAEILPAAVMALAALGLVWMVITRGMAPLDRARAEIMQRSHEDLRPLEKRNTPVELAPTVDAINHLLSALRDSNAVERRFLTNAAHQLRTPLAGLQMHLDLMLQRDVPGVIRDELQAMYDTTVRTSRLANQLLVLAKAEAFAERPRQTGSVNLRSLGQAAAEDWVPAAIRLGIDLGFDLDDATVTGDTLLLAEMLNNLIDNALRYTPPGGSASVRCGVLAEQPFLSVEDSGPGIPTWAHAMVFERFFRLQGTPGDGAGLGLAVVREIADQHGAKVRIDSREGSGTRLTILFAARSAALV